MDAGIATQENVDWLKAHHYPYLVVSRKKHRIIGVRVKLIAFN